MPYRGAGGIAEIKAYCVRGSGSCYVLTVNESRIDMGDIKPILTLPLIGSYLILSSALLKMIDYQKTNYNLVRLYLRKSSGTPEDIESSFRYYDIGPFDFSVGGDSTIVLPPLIYTTTDVNTVIEMWGDIEEEPDSGELHIAGSDIVAIYLR